jgi:CheY-like chemotaxis protein
MPTPSAAARDLSALTALVVEDDPLLRSLLVSALGRVFGRVVEAGDSERALEVAEHEKEVSFLLAELRLPGHSCGVDLARQLRARWPGLRAAFCTGRGPDEFEDCGVDPSEMLSVTKPFGLDALRQVIDDAFATSR